MLPAAAAPAHDRHDRRQLRPDLSRSRPQRAVHRMDGLHSQVAAPIILSCCDVSEQGFEHDDIPPSASFTLRSELFRPGAFPPLSASIAFGVTTSR